MISIKRASSISFFLMIFPAIFSMMPLESIGLSGNLLQRLSFQANAGFPYWDILVVPMIFLSALFFICGVSAARDLLLVLPFIVIVVLCFISSSGLPVNQSVGLFLLYGGVAIYHVTSRVVVDHEFVRRLNRFMAVQSYFGMIASIVLILHIFGVLRYSESMLVFIDRFEGESFRVRWEVVRGAEKMLICSSSAWAIYSMVSKRNILYLAFPLIFCASQLLQSSRGGVLLVLLSAFTVLYVFPLGVSKARASRRTIINYVIIFLFLGFGVALISMTSAGRALLFNVGEIADSESIRARMTDAALAIYAESPVFGKGFFNLYEHYQWAPFILSNMLLPIHNMFINYLVYFGVVGTVIFSAIILCSILDVYKIKRKLSCHDQAAMCYSAGVAASVFLGGAYMIIFQYFDRVSVMYLWAFLGLIRACSSGLKKNDY